MIIPAPLTEILLSFKELKNRKGISSSDVTSRINYKIWPLLCNWRWQKSDIFNSTICNISQQYVNRVTGTALNH